MNNVTILPGGSIGKYFIPKEYLPDGKDEYHIRNLQTGRPKESWRHLRPDEIERLSRNNNTCDNWDGILVSSEFDPRLIHDTEFFGLVRIGALRNVVLEHHDLRVPAGITKSRIISCDIGDDVAIHDVRYCAHYIIGNRAILASIDEMHTTDHAKFGNGILKDGEREDARAWMEIMNEAGGRKVLPFDGMIAADAYLWAKYRDDGALQKRLIELTQNRFDSRRGFYGSVGEQCVIKNSSILKDVKVGDCACIRGAHEIRNVTVNSSGEEQTSIGEGAELVNGIIGRGCHVLYGCKAVRFVLADNSNLNYGARLINSFLGENSTISCCEVLHNLIFPAHEQHHNNSFLIASLVMGQSNLAAAATIGSNHNSRSNDNEIQAGRGFWPGLCTSVKHSCRFASFILLSKADYPAEMDIPLPFSLLNNNQAKDRLEVMPAYWWMHNMYALARNSWKFRTRDKRKNKVQHIEFEPLAPDTIEEIFKARELLEIWTAKAELKSTGQSVDGKSDGELCRFGRGLLAKSKDRAASLEVIGERMEKSGRAVAIIKTAEGYEAYGDMVHYYAVRNLFDYLKENPGDDFARMCKALKGYRVRAWTNLGGQLVPTSDVDRLRADIGCGKLDTWEKVHGRYDILWESYPHEKQKHAFAALCDLLEISIDDLTKQQWVSAVDKAIAIQDYVCEQVYISRKKDDDNPFRQATFRNLAEMTATVGVAEENSFIKQVRNETEAFKKTAEEIKRRG